MKKVKLKGFSIIESMVSVSVIFIVLTPPIYLAFNLFNANIIFKNKKEATNIAATGVEIVLNYRESWRNYCDIGGRECDIYSYGFNNFYDDIKTCAKSSPCKIDDSSFRHSSSDFDSEISRKDYLAVNLRKVYYDNLEYVDQDGGTPTYYLALKENKTDDINYGDVVNYVNQGQDTIFSRVIWFDNKEELISVDGVSRVSFGVKFYSMVCINNIPCNPSDIDSDTVNWSKTVLLTSYIYR